MQWHKMLVIDFECTCFRDTDADKPVGWVADTHQEITEIGAAIINLPERKLEAVEAFLVRPDGPMGVFCKELTSLTFEDVKEMGGLKERLDDMRLWCKLHRYDIGQMPWGSWGDYDRVQLYRECVRKGIKYPFGRSHFSIKGLFSMMTGRKKGFGLGGAMAELGMEFDGRPHRGVDDAKNTAEVYLHLLRGCK